ncbi:MAG: hypothetical protein IPO66_22410 [Rhodanobacteraceae bacterium]|nr:hypothetical protein [Rhodanobacteraceae bacterium]
MQRLMIRALIPMALTLTLAACGDEPAATTEEAPKVAATATPAAPPAATPVKAPPPPPKLPDAVSPYERAMRAMTSGTSLHFESEVALTDGSSQYATGVSNEHNYAFSVRSLPKANADLDGNWFFNGGRYLHESTTGYDSSAMVPSAMAIMAQVLDVIPKSETALAVDPPVAEMVGSVSCQLRKVNLTQSPGLLGQYRAISVCIDETNVRLVKLQAELQTGERLTASFSDYGMPVQLPQVTVPDWTKEFPRN